MFKGIKLSGFIFFALLIIDKSGVVTRIGKFTEHITASNAAIRHHRLKSIRIVAIIDGRRNFSEVIRYFFVNSRSCSLSALYDPVSRL
jgi:hypothetical protein